MAKRKPYCDPWSAGLASEQSAVNRRLARLIDALETEINRHIVKPESKILGDIDTLARKLRAGLASDGYTLKYDHKRNRPKVSR